MSRREIEALRKQQTQKKTVRSRKKRSTILSDKTMKQVIKKFDEDHDPQTRVREDVNIDEHVKMNDVYLRSGWYVPKKK